MHIHRKLLEVCMTLSAHWISFVFSSGLNKERTPENKTKCKVLMANSYRYSYVHLYVCSRGQFVCMRLSNW